MLGNTRDFLDRLNKSNARAARAFGLPPTKNKNSQDYYNPYFGPRIFFSSFLALENLARQATAEMPIISAITFS